MTSVASHLVLLRELLSADRLEFLLQLRNLLPVQLILFAHLLLDHAIALLFLTAIIFQLIFEDLDTLVLIRIVDLGFDLEVRKSLL